MLGSPEPESRPGARVVLLGASNLTRGFSAVVSLSHARVGGPLEVLAALGHGRSYGMVSRFLARTLPGIGGCGLWRRLEAAPDVPTWALLTDLGNDLAFGAPPEKILGWVRACLDRLGDARVIVSGLPLPSLRALAPWQFALWAAVFFPGRGLKMERVLAGAAELEQGLTELARERGLALVASRGEWFGSDPIHFSRSRVADAWGGILEPWGEAPSAGLAVPLPAPAWRRVLGFSRTTVQPAVTLQDGTTVSVY
jgi:hypothetical protein